MNTKKKSHVMEQIEKFIEQLHNGDISFSPEAQQLKMEVPTKGAFGMKTKKEVGSLSDLLGKAIARYQLFKDQTPEVPPTTAYYLLDLIERARTHGVVIQENLTNKLDDCQQEYNQLKEENDKLKEENIRLNQLNEALHQTLDNLGARRVD